MESSTSDVNDRSSAAESPPDVAALFARLHQIAEAMYSSERNYADPDAGLIAEVTRVVRQLSKTGPRHVIEAGLAAVIDTAVILAVRLQVAVNWHLGVVDRSGGGHRGRDALDLPASVQALLPSMNELGLLIIRLSEAFAKFTHIISLSEKRNGAKRKRSTRSRKKMGRHPAKNGKGTVTSVQARLLGSGSNHARPQICFDSLLAAR